MLATLNFRRNRVSIVKNLPRVKKPKKITNLALLSQGKTHPLCSNNADSCDFCARGQLHCVICGSWRGRGPASDGARVLARVRETLDSSSFYWTLQFYQHYKPKELLCTCVLEEVQKFISFYIHNTFEVVQVNKMYTLFFNC